MILEDDQSCLRARARWSTSPETSSVSRHSRTIRIELDNDRDWKGSIGRPKDNVFSCRIMRGSRWDSSKARPEGVHHQRERTTTASNHAWWAVRLGSIRIGWEWSSYEVAPEWRADWAVGHRVVSITRYSRFWTRYSQPLWPRPRWSAIGEVPGVWATSTYIRRIGCSAVWPR